VTTVVDWDKVRDLLDDLYTASSQLEDLFPGRKFTLDGHLVGSVGEVIAAYMLDLDLNPASTMGYDAVAPDGRLVEIKLTQGTSAAIRHEPDHLLVLHRPAGGPVRVVFNGPGTIAWKAAGKMASNCQRRISLSKLSQLDLGVPASERLTAVREAPV
jgi:hypothetical protein